MGAPRAPVCVPAMIYLSARYGMDTDPEAHLNVPKPLVLPIRISPGCWQVARTQPHYLASMVRIGITWDDFLVIEDDGSAKRASDLLREEGLDPRLGLPTP
jgi:hypothetical protein